MNLIDHLKFSPSRHDLDGLNSSYLKVMIIQSEAKISTIQALELSIHEHKAVIFECQERIIKNQQIFR